MIFWMGETDIFSLFSTISSRLIMIYRLMVLSSIPAFGQGLVIVAIHYRVLSDILAFLYTFDMHACLEVELVVGYWLVGIIKCNCWRNGAHMFGTRGYWTWQYCAHDLLIEYRKLIGCSTGLWLGI